MIRKNLDIILNKNWYKNKRQGVFFEKLYEHGKS